METFDLVVGTAHEYNAVFKDAAGNIMSWPAALTVTSADTTIATVVVAGDVVTITPVAVGSTTVTVSDASDSLTCEATIVVTAAPPASLSLVFAH